MLPSAWTQEPCGVPRASLLTGDIGKTAGRRRALQTLLGQHPAAEQRSPVEAETPGGSRCSSRAGGSGRTVRSWTGQSPPT